MLKKLKVAVIATTALAGCQSSFEGSYEDPNKIDIVDDKWSDDDARISVEALIDDMMDHPWLREFKRENGNNRPKLLLSDFDNRTSEHIDTKHLFTDAKAKLLRVGKVRFMGGGKKRDAILKEIQYQNSGAVRSDQAKQLGQQLAADVLLSGEITAIENRRGGKKLVTYQISMTLTNIKTAEDIWVGAKKIRKKFKRSGYRP